MLKKSVKNDLIVQYQGEVESVISLGVVIPGKESFQTRARELIRDFTRNLDIYHPEFALSIAYSELDRLARDLAHLNHHRHVFNCSCCHANMQDRDLRDSR